MIINYKIIIRSFQFQTLRICASRPAPKSAVCRRRGCPPGPPPKPYFCCSGRIFRIEFRLFFDLRRPDSHTPCKHKLCTGRLHPSGAPLRIWRPRGLSCNPSPFLQIKDPRLCTSPPSAANSNFVIYPSPSREFCPPPYVLAFGSSCSP